MCGIFALLNDSYCNTEFIKKQFNKGKNIEPELSKLIPFGSKGFIGFHRLSINFLNPKSNKPIQIDDFTLICNGEIYNYRELYSLMNVTPTTDSDCEVIIHLYKKYGIEQTLQMLDGVFSFILCDIDIYSGSNKMYIARDPYGVRPLYTLKSKNFAIDKKIGFASELKCLSEFQTENYIIEQFKPGTYSVCILPYIVLASWQFYMEYVSYHNTGFTSTMFSSGILNETNCDTIFTNIRKYLKNAVKKRCTTTERPIACLLSGGLDSSLITALVNEYTNGTLETYSIGLPGSEDLKYAKIVADYLGTKHTEIVLSEKDFTDAIPEVIKAIESYDTTSVRASIGNYLIGKYIAANSQAKVIFNGDGSDELCGGYLYMNKCPDALEFDKESRRLLKDIHFFDMLRSDKCISSHGLETRTPFLDRSWVQYYLSIDPRIRYHPGTPGQCEKFLLRSAFSLINYTTSEGKALLPDSILWRTKEAFSDGVSKTSQSFYQIIQEHIETLGKISFTTNALLAQTNEQNYYKSIFNSHYPNASNVVPYYWMPKYVNATDASARTLHIYDEINAST